MVAHGTHNDGRRFSQEALLKLKGPDLPITEFPLRIAILKGANLASNSWKVEVNKKGDAYIFTRDEKIWQTKASLHVSGEQHICTVSYDKKSNIPMDMWHEPDHDGRAVPTLRLLFPSWGYFREVKPEKILPKKKGGGSNVLIEGHDKLLTVVSFIIMDESKSLRRTPSSFSWLHCATHRLRPGKSLFVVASYESAGRYREEAEVALQKIRAMLFHSDTYKRLPKQASNATVFLQGHSSENCHFILPLSVLYTPSPG